MSDKILHLAAQYTRHVVAKAHVRPYQNKSALRNQISGSLHMERLPEEDHHRVELEITVQALNEENESCFTTSACIEAIVLAKGYAEEELSTVLTQNIGGLLAGNIRAALSTASAGSGYGPIILPPLSAQQIAALVAPEE